MYKKINFAPQVSDDVASEFFFNAKTPEAEVVNDDDAEVVNEEAEEEVDDALARLGLEVNDE